MVCRTLDEFEKRWKNICEKVERISLDNRQAKMIVELFLDEMEIFQINIIGKKIDKGLMRLSVQETFTMLNISLQLAMSNYERFSKPSIFRRIFGDTFKPELNIDINAVKNILK